MAACQAPLVRTPAATPELLRIQYTPALRHWSQDLNHCASSLPLLGLVVNETSAPQLDLVSADLELRFGPPLKLTGYPAVIAYDAVVIVVNPANPISSLTPAQVSAIYHGQTVDWKDLPGNAASQPIHAWTYLPEDDLRQVFDQAFIGVEGLVSGVNLAPDPAAMLAEVAKDPAAIGYLLKSQADKTVLALSLNGQPASELRQPILALAKSEPQGNLRQLVLCLQK